MKPITLIIRDGWGSAPPSKFNAITTAATPNDDRYLNEYPHTMLDASGLPVGVPDGAQGSSEVGHLNMGAGRIVKQEVVRINEGLADGSLFATPRFTDLLENCKRNGSAFHVMGLVQDQGVHAQQDHLFAILKHVAAAGITRVWVHFFGDGRDTGQHTATGFLTQLEDVMSTCPGAQIGTLMGRYYAMDRGENWNLTDLAYAAIVRAEAAVTADSARQAIERSWAKDNTPDGGGMVDEYIPPTVIGDYPGVAAGDSVMHFNYRQDRAIQLAKAFVADDYPGERGSQKPDITFCGLTRYYDEFAFGLIPPLNESKDMLNLLGEVVARAGLRQLRIAETQKFRHVTSFFNGKRMEPNVGEDQVEIDGTWDPAAYALHPEMDAPRAAARAVELVQSGKYDMIALNFANCDMVGHTGDMAAAVQAVEVVDNCVGRVVDAVLAAGGAVLLTADHGNAEQMADPETGKPKTAHTINPVSLIYIAADAADVKLRPHGKLSDIAPTMLHLLGLEAPADMTAVNLIV